MEWSNSADSEHFPPSLTDPFHMNLLMAITATPSKTTTATTPKQTPRTMATRILLPTVLDDEAFPVAVPDFLPQGTEIAVPQSFGFPRKFAAGIVLNCPP